MFLHLGADVVVPFAEVIAILNVETGTGWRSRNEFLHLAMGTGKVVDISESTPKSYVITERAVYLSPISSLTLKKRAEDAQGYFTEISAGERG